MGSLPRASRFFLLTGNDGITPGVDLSASISLENYCVVLLGRFSLDLAAGLMHTRLGVTVGVHAAGTWMYRLWDGKLLFARDIRTA